MALFYALNGKKCCLGEKNGLHNRLNVQNCTQKHINLSIMFTQQQKIEKKVFATKHIIFMCVLFGLLLFSQVLMAQSTGDYRTAATGNWSVLATWQRYDGASWLTPTVGQGYPGQYLGTGVVTIQNGNVITITANVPQAIGELLVNDGVLNTNTNADRTFNITGNLTVALGSTYDLTRSRLTVNGNTTINGTLSDTHNGGWAIFAGAFTISNTGAFSTANSSAYTFRGGIVNNGVLNKTGTGAVTFNTNNQIIGGLNAATMNGTLTVTDITVTNNFSSLTLTRPNAGAITGTGTWIQGEHAILHTAASTITIATFDCITNANTVVFNRNNTQTIPGIIFHNLTLTNGSTKTLGAGVIVNNDFTLENNTSFNPAGYDFTANGNSVIAGILADGTIAGTTTLHDVNLSGGTINGAATGVVNINGNLTVASANGTIGRIDLTVNGTTSISASRTLTLNSNTGIKTFVGAVTNDGTWTSTTITTASNLLLQDGFTNNSATNAAFGAATFSTNSQALAGTGSFTFTSASIISGAITLTNNSSHTNGVTFTGTINGTEAGSTLANGASKVMFYNNATQPMATGILDASAAGNSFYYNLAGAQAVKASTYHNLFIQNGNTKTLGGNVVVNNNFTLATGTTFNPVANDLTVNGNSVIAGILADGTIAGTTTLHDVDLSGGTINGAATGVVNINGNLSVASANGTIGRMDVTVNGTTSISASRTLTLNSNTGVKTFVGTITNDGTWTSTTITTASNLLLQDGFTNNSATNAAFGAATFTTNNQALSGTGSFTFAGASIIEGAITLTNNSSHNNGVTFNNTINGTIAGSTLANGAGSIIFYQPNATTMPMVTGTISNVSGSTFHYSRNNAQFIKAATYGNLSVTTGTKSLAAATVVAGNLNIAAATTLDVTASNFALTVGGNWANAGTFNARNGTVTFNGSVSQNISSNESSFYNLTFNNSAAGSNAIVLANDVTITNLCTMTDGIIYTGSNRLILTSTTAANLSGFSNESYVSGNLRRYIANNTSTYALPVGNNTNYYRADIKNNNLNGITYIDANYSSLQRHDDVDMNVNDGAELTYISIASNMWTIDPNTPPSSGSYDIYLYTGNISGLSDNEFSVIKRPTGSPDATSWTTGGGTINAGGGNGRKISDGYALRMGLTSFSEFGIGSTQAGNPLPVQLVSFTAKLNKQSLVDLKWVTATEINNDFFSVERSIDAINFEEILQVKGAGNASRMLTYSAVDSKPLTGVSYYRLKQTDFDGTFTYSNVVSITNNAVTTNIPANVNWTVFPNPAFAGGLMSVTADGITSKIKVTVYNATTGSLVAEAISANEQATIALSENLKSGLYIVNIQDDEKTTSKRIIIQ
jgi:hypothetical protein